MAIQDISRSLFDPRKAYTGVRMQQGRVLLDDDWNDAGEIAAEDGRRARVHVIGPAGSPDDGFKVVDPPTATADSIDFELEAGSFYLGGQRLELSAREGFLAQTDWLRGPDPRPATPADGRRDLVWIEAWEQPVSAVEDSEIREPALGGPDTTTRVRLTHRVRVATDVGTVNCRTAWANLTAEMAANGRGVLDAGNELISDAALTVTYVPGAPPADLCSPAVAGGYLGAENQALRVQLVDSDSLTWGFDNASPLYRVRLAGDGVTVTMDTLPRDQAHWPTAGHVVELLPWGSVLPNGEKVAEQGGHLSRLASSYDPDSHQLTLATAAPAPTSPPAPPASIYGEEWRARGDAVSLEGEGAYLYMRVWSRGSDRASPPAIPFAPGVPVTLGQTGIAVTIAGTARRPGDHWILATRPETPQQVLPWSLESGRAPHGVRRWAAPLALIEWSGDGSAAVGSVLDDCRETFRPLTRQKTCCRFRVGDGVNSYGDFTRIQEAIDALPPEGGEICVLDGEYRERLLIEGRADVKIGGCGAQRCRILPPTGTVAPAVTIRDCTGVTLRGLGIEALADEGILAEGTIKGALHGIRFQDIHVIGRDLPAIVVRGNGHDVQVVDCRLDIRALAADLGAGSDIGRRPALYLAADHVLIHGCEVFTDSGASAARTAFGGIQLAGLTDDVEIRRCSVRGGNGHGITLGSIRLVPEDALDETDPALYDDAVASGEEVPAGGYIIVDDGGCVHVGGTPPDDTGGQPELVPVSEGPLTDIRILDNEITGMGSCGISVVRFFDLSGPHPQLVTVDRVLVRGNRIYRCLRLEPLEAPPTLRAVSAQGGITLADGYDITIRENLVEETGRTHSDPVCGIFVLRSEGIVIEQNRIIDSGPREGSAPPRAGQRGGVVLPGARPRTMLVDTIFAEGSARADGAPAVRVHDNVVVQPTGRALRIMGTGTMSVQNNQLTSRGNTVLSFLEQLIRLVVEGMTHGLTGGEEMPEDDPLDEPTVEEILLELLSGSTVTILNFGIAREALFLLRASNLKAFSQFNMASYQSVEMEPGQLMIGSAITEGAMAEAGGLVSFHDNQVLLDLREREFTLALCSVLLLSLDDVSCQDNQMDCHLDADFVLANLISIGFTCRTSGNRLREDFLRTLRSGVTAGVLNQTHHNIGTHCFTTLGSSVPADRPTNQVLMNLMSPGFCGDDS